MRSKTEYTSDEEDEFLLQDEDNKANSSALKQRRPFYQSIYFTIILNIVTISLYTSIFFYMVHTSSCSFKIPSPANKVIEYQRKTFWPVTYDNDFTGDPRPEFDQAWHELLEYSHIRVSKEELEAANYTSLPFKDGTGYVAQLASTHQLHCLKQIRHYLHRDHYFPNATELEIKAQGMHVDHCLEVLRLSTMCAGDTSLTPMYFAETDDGLLYPFVKSRTYHHCVNWDRLREFSKDRSVDLFDPDLLALPPGTTLLDTPVPSMVM